MSTSQKWPRKSPSGLIIVAPDHRRPAFGGDGLECLLAHPQVAEAGMHHLSEVPQAILDVAARTGRYDDMTAAALRSR